MLSPSKLLDEVLTQVGLGLVRSKAERLQTVNECLQLNSQRGISLVLVVNEAYAIESVKRFEELRLLTNFQRYDRPPLTVVLIGQPEVRHRVAGIPHRGSVGTWVSSRQRRRRRMLRNAWALRQMIDVFTKVKVAVIYEQSKGLGG